ncbi:neuroblast differentiation-associated protein AHNAK [Nematolebias whitei]|uniref:neuroblast differentiation-associated protein AHNAK n=1 Tax=Nematolebias whitei TaxID=451745 RepID=UPI00189A4F34|nr:neuroblast differentiation-associated protein AHNAK [Nematolebias whitei]
MEEDEETREVLFPDWEGPDQTGLTIEQASGGELFVKEVKGESPAARSGKVYQGDQIVGATIYFDNMSSEETAELLKTLNKHKVGLKLQNKGEKSPCHSPMSTPCRSPMGTLTWEGRLGATSPDVILSGDDEDYKRIYTRKIKPRLKSEDLAEGVDVRTERHSSTSSDGSTITTVTRRITTYTVEMPSGISEKLELSSPEFKGLQHETGDGSPRMRIVHSSSSGKVERDDGVFESTGIRGKSPNIEVTSHEGTEILRGRGEKGARSIHVFEALGDSTKSSTMHVTIGGSEGAGKTSNDENGRSIKHEKINQMSTTSMDKTQTGGSGSSFVERTVKTSKGTISQPQKQGSSCFKVRIEGESEDVDEVTTEFSSDPGETSLAVKDVTIQSSKWTDKNSNEGETVAMKIESKCPDVKIFTKEGDVKMSHMKMPSVKTTEANVKSDYKSQESYKTGIKIPHMGMPSFGLKDPKVEGADVDVRQNINKPSTSEDKFYMSDVDLNLKDPKLKKNEEISIKRIEGDIKTLDIKIKTPEIDQKGKEGGFVMPKAEMPSIKLKGHKIDIQDIEYRLKGPNLDGDLDVKMSKVTGDIKAPDVDIEDPAIYTEGQMGGIKMSKFKLPSYGLKGQKVDGSDVDINLPKANIDVKAPDVDIKGLDIKIEGPDAKRKGSKTIMPSISGPQISMPDVDLNLTGPKSKGDVDVNEPRLKGDFKTPDSEIKTSEIEIEGKKGVFEMSKIKMSSVNIKGPKIESPDVDISLKGQALKGDVDVKMPKVKGGINAPDVEIECPDIDIESHKGGIKMPKAKMPSFGWKGPKVEGPDVDINLLKADIDVKTPDIDIKEPDVDIEGRDAKLKEPKFNVPSMSGPKISMPDVDFSLKGPRLKGDVDVNVPKIKGDIKTPDIAFNAPKIDLEVSKGGFEMPKIKMPTLNIKGPKLESPDFDINLKGPKLEGDMDVKMPKVKGDIKAPDVDIEGPDIDIESHKGGIKIPKFKMPSFGLKGPNVEGPDVDINLPKADIDVKAPNIDIKGPDVEIEGPDTKFQGPKFNMPLISGPNISMPDVNFNLKGPKLKGDVDINAPKIKGDIKTPDIDINAPKIDIEGPKGGFEMPKIKMPSLNIKGPKMESPDFDINLKSPKLEGDMDVKMPKVKGDIKAPDIDIEGPDIDTEGHKGGFKMPKFKMPSFGFKSAKVESPDVDINLPKAKIDMKAPDIDIKGPEVDIEGPNTKLKGPKFNMPSFSGPKISMPDVDLNLKGSKLKGDVDVNAPKIDIEGPKGGFEMPKMKMPSLNIKSPKLEGPDFDINLKGPKLEGDVGFKIPKVKGEITTPDVDIEGPDIDIEGHKGGIKMPKFKMPSFGLKGPKVEGPDVDINLPKADIDVNAPDIDIKGPDVDIEGPDAKLKGPKFHMPSISGPKISMPDVDFNLKGPKLKGDVDINAPKIKGEIKTPDIDIKSPKIDIEAPKGGFEMPKIKMPPLNIKGPNLESPDFDINLKGPKLEGNMDVTIPKISGDIKAPDVDIKSSEIDIDRPKGVLEIPKIKMPFGFKSATLPSADVLTMLPFCSMRGFSLSQAIARGQLVPQSSLGLQAMSPVRPGTDHIWLNSPPWPLVPFKRGKVLMPEVCSALQTFQVAMSFCWQ